MGAELRAAKLSSRCAALERDLAHVSARASANEHAHSQRYAVLQLELARAAERCAVLELRLSDTSEAANAAQRKQAEQCAALGSHLARTNGRCAALELDAMGAKAAAAAATKESEERHTALEGRLEAVHEAIAGGEKKRDERYAALQADVARTGDRCASLEAGLARAGETAVATEKQFAERSGAVETRLTSMCALARTADLEIAKCRMRLDALDIGSKLPLQFSPAAEYEGFGSKPDEAERVRARVVGHKGAVTSHPPRPCNVVRRKTEHGPCVGGRRGAPSAAEPQEVHCE